MSEDQQATPSMNKMRFQVGPLGEYDEDAMFEEVFLTNSTMAQVAKLLIAEAIAARKSYRDERLKYIANKRGMTLEEFRAMLHRDRQG